MLEYDKIDISENGIKLMVHISVSFPISDTF